MEDDNEAKENKTRPSTSKARDRSDAETEEGKRENRNHNDDHASRDSTMTVNYKASTSFYTSESESFAPTPTIDPNAKSDEANLHMVRRAAGRVQSKRPKNKRRARKTVAGRVQKKKRSRANRQVVIRAPRRSAKRQRRAASTSTIHSLSSEVSVAQVCSHCGHCCCRWRLELELRAQFCGSCRQELRKYLSSNHIQKTAEKSQKSKLTTIKTRHRNRKSLRSEGIQIGSRCSMLSPLLISRNVVEKDAHPQSNHYEITAEMIYEALRQLTMWSEFVPTNSILNYLVQNYPVNRNKQELMAELLVKLNICELIGIATKALDGETWRLSCKMMNRNLQPNHVNLFWQLYHDQLRPFGKKGTQEPEYGRQG